MTPNDLYICNYFSLSNFFLVQLKKRERKSNLITTLKAVKWSIFFLTKIPDEMIQVSFHETADSSSFTIKSIQCLCPGGLEFPHQTHATLNAGTRLASKLVAVSQSPFKIWSLFTTFIHFRHMKPYSVRLCTYIIPAHSTGARRRKIGLTGGFKCN